VKVNYSEQLNKWSVSEAPKEKLCSIHSSATFVVTEGNVFLGVFSSVNSKNNCEGSYGKQFEPFFSRKDYSIFQESRGWTQSLLGAKAGVTRAAVSSVENGHVTTGSTVARISRGLEIPPDLFDAVRQILQQNALTKNKSRRRVVGKFVRFVRKSRALSQRQFGEKAGFSQTSISNVENGKVVPQSTVTAIARALDIPADASEALQLGTVTATREDRAPLGKSATRPRRPSVQLESLARRRNVRFAALRAAEWTDIDWKEAARWGKETNKYSSGERRFAYQIAIAPCYGWTLSEPQQRAAERLKEKAILGGFTPRRLRTRRKK
jgi:transcriptional regulator with XRE-family HTH domain